MLYALTVHVCPRFRKKADIDEAALTSKPHRRSYYIGTLLSPPVKLKLCTLMQKLQYAAMCAGSFVYDLGPFIYVSNLLPSLSKLLAIPTPAT